MIKKTLLISSIILFTGCTGNKVYIHPKYSPQKFNYDKAVCSNFARGAYGDIPYRNIPSYNKQYNVSGYVNNSYYSGTITQQPTMQQNINGIAQGLANIAHQKRTEEAFDACMFQKGWRLSNNNSDTKITISKPINERDTKGYDVDGYNRNGFDINGFDRFGFNKEGIHKVTKTKFNEEGYDINGYNKNGYNKNKDFDYNRMSESKLINEIKKDSDIFLQIKKPSEKLQKVAVDTNPFLIYEIENPSEEVQFIAVRRDKRSFKMIDNPTPKVKKFIQGLDY